MRRWALAIALARVGTAGEAEARAASATTVAIAQDAAENPVEAALARIEAERAAAADPARTPAERAAALERLLMARWALIDARPADPRRAVWLADQAEDLLFLALPAEGADLEALFGRPTETRLADFRALVERLHETAEAAEHAIADAILQLESSPGYRDDVETQMLRRRWARNERDRRVPFLRGVAASLRAEVGGIDETTRRSLREVAVDRLSPLIESMPGSLKATAMRHDAFARLGLGRVEEALERLDRVIETPEATAGDVLAARLGRVQAIEALRGPAAALEALHETERAMRPGDAFTRLLLADVRSRLLERSEGPGAATGAYERLVDTPTDLPNATWREILLDRMARTVDPNARPSELSPLASIALAARRATTDATRGEAVEILRATLARPGLDDATRATALFELGRTLHAAGRALEAARAFDEIARELPTDPRAERAIRLAAALLAELAVRPSPDPEARDALRATLRLMFRRYDSLPDIDRWRLEMGRLALAQGRHDEATEALQPIPAGAAEWAEARTLVAETAVARAEATEDPAARVRAMERALETVERTAENLAEASHVAPDLRRETTMLRARALLGLGRADEALEALRDLDPATLPAEAAGDLLTLRLRAFEATGSSEALTREIERLAAAAPDRVGRVLPAMLDAVATRVRTARDEGREEDATSEARRTLLPLARALATWVDANPDAPGATAIRLRVGEAYLLANEPAAALEAFEAVRRDRPDALPVLLGQAEALFALRRDAEAMPIYRRLAGARREARDEAFWTSELRMLQILDRVGKNSDRIRPRIERLRAIDPALGGERFRRGFERLVR